MQKGKDNLDGILNELKGKKSKEEAEDFLMKKLSPTQSKKLNDILSNENATKELLSSPQAQSLLKRLMGDKNG